MTDDSGLNPVSGLLKIEIQNGCRIETPCRIHHTKPITTNTCFLFPEYVQILFTFATYPSFPISYFKLISSIFDWCTFSEKILLFSLLPSFVVFNLIGTPDLEIEFLYWEDIFKIKSVYVVQLNISYLNALKMAVRLFLISWIQ